MITHEEADRVFNLYADLESSFSDLCCLIGTDNTVNRACIDGPLFLVSQHIGMLNQQLYQLLRQLTDSKVDMDAPDCATGAAGAATAPSQPESLTNGSDLHESA